MKKFHQEVVNISVSQDLYITRTLQEWCWCHPEGETYCCNKVVRSILGGYPITDLTK